ncbi:excinuclease ABC subunit UvrB [Aliarcobacter thereius]|uniref:UvrABC system protein B n=2 Tax=Aliarcobacter thereius TaxID=544718 RepID=A0A1C0B6I2_9BACT|nr:excinuclease ABC subunit UvrB [Aliarcobacter thereius]OCL90936.1 UvrABC system protein B [Aliarcobacter thereius]OCL96235.1 UvrABC system protein B [Aliarcobacter thereius LMG 24486]OCL98903.1 UvrABC system protein B [Aliarcobacter thereius]QBF15800.1 UvrABC nucleotide excision repair complex, subunit UvrB [Aliarcobacter thereius LMG 24486]TLS94853.1 excinuclease ABC subunit UvrB [Aliarcobacter thereius]
MAKFEVVSDYSPNGDQPKAIEALSSSIEAGNKYNTLLGVTGSGKTYTIAKVIEKVQKPTLIMTHNKTLAAQLYSEFKQFFPNNHVEYFISYYDYYQPEAYIPRSDLFIEKDSSINEELERLRLSTTASLLSFDDVIVIASVSANYGLGNPSEYKAMVQRIEVGFEYSQREFLLKLIEMGYKRNDSFFDRSDFRVNGDVIDIFPAYYEDEFIRVEFFGDEVESITKHEYLTNEKIEDLKEVIIYSVNPFVVTKDNLSRAVKQIEDELEDRLNYYKQEDKLVEHQRLKQRVEFDLEMIEATGMCKGIENYARHLTGLKPEETPYSLLDYFSQMDKDFLLVVDESHVSLSQFRGMHAADRSRKEVLVEYGFRLPSALDNRPLKFDEFINKAPNYIFVSATPNELEIELSATVAEQIIRPTGLLDPIIDIVDSEFQVEKLHDEIKKVVAKNQRVLVTVLTKKMAEELAKYYADLGIKVKYMHSEIDAIQRNQIIRELRLGTFDVLIGINLLREGLDIPETSLVAILDADKEGFLRSKTSLIQTIGRAARNENGRVILFAKKITASMQFAIDETNRRRKLQEEHNIKFNITPKSTTRKLDESLRLEEYDTVALKKQRLEKMPASERKKILIELNKQMKKAASDLNFEEAIRLRDEIAKYKDM